MANLDEFEPKTGFGVPVLGAVQGKGDLSHGTGHPPTDLLHRRVDEDQMSPLLSTRLVGVPPAHGLR